MANIQITEASKTILKTKDNEPHKVCAYCRVSTDESDQKNSLSTQKQFFERYFQQHKNWTNAGIFSDEGLSGTSYEKRDDFNRMLSYARQGKIDIILTKEVSRFSRNVQDFLNIIEELRNRGVFVWFLSDDINTEENDYREKLSQIALNAEQESLKTSRRVKWGQRQQMENGVVFGRKEMFGYNIVKNDQGKQCFEIIEEEAKIVKLIFEWFASGDGTFRIANRLRDMGVKTKRYKNGWSNTVILRLLRNEKYVGDLEQGKTYTPDALTHKKKYNRGQSHKIYIKDHHPESAIIERELWDKVQAILKEKQPPEEIRAMHSNRYWVSGKIVCGLCGKRYVSLRKKQQSIPYKAWICVEKNSKGKYRQIINDNGEPENIGCNALRVNDRVLKTAIYDIITQIIKPQREAICNSILSEIKEANKPKNNSKKIASLQRKIDQLTQELITLTDKMVKGIVSEEMYSILSTQKENDRKSLQKQKEELSQYDNSDNEIIFYKNCLSQIEEIISLNDDEINEELFERITKKIVVHPLKILEFHLSFIPKPIYMQYTTKSRGELYKIDFTILNEKQFTELIKTAPKNEIEDINAEDL